MSTKAGLAGCLAIAALWPQTAGAEPGLTSFRGVGPTVVLVGDSNSVNSRSLYHGRADDHWATSFNAVAGTTIAQHMGELDTAAKLNPRAIQIDLVTNDANPAKGGGPWIVSLWRQALNRTLDGKVDCVVVVKPWLGKTFLDRRWLFWNVHLLPVLDDFPNVRIVDWDKRVRANQHWLTADGTHFIEYGYRAYAETQDLANLRCPAT